MGRYYPPDSSAAPTFNKTHPLGARASKLKTQGILTVRFEMPFAIWCSTCLKPSIIGQGVRFNAEKKKVGNYHSTPIWSFRMKHVVCGGWIEIRTDPKASEYVVVEGAKRRDYGEDRAEREEDGSVLDEEERKRRREDAMAGLEGKRDEEVVKKEAGKRIGELLEDRQKWWSDPFEASRFVRKGFRKERKVRHRERDKSEGIKSRLGLGLELLPETAEDAQRAKLIEFGEVKAIDAGSKPLFHPAQSTSKTSTAKSMKSRSRDLQAKAKQDLEMKVRSSALAAKDPFAVGKRGQPEPGKSSMSAATPTDGERVASHDVTQAPVPSSGLVDYDSDE